MSIANTMNEMQAYLRETYQALIEKQAIIPEKKNLVNVPTAIRSISGEGSTLPILNLNLPNEIEYNFDELKTETILPLSAEHCNDYAQGSLVLLFGFKVNQDGWAVNSGGNVYCEQNWRTQDISLGMDIWNQEDFGYQIVCVGIQDGYQTLVKDIPIKYTPPTKAAERIYILDRDGMEVKNRLTLDDIEVYNVATGEAVNKKYVRKEVDYWTDTFYLSVEPNTEYEVRVTLFGEIYTGTFTSPYDVGKWSDVSLFILPTLWSFEGRAATFNEGGYQISLLANSAEVTQYQGDTIVKQETLYPGANENSPELICAQMLPDIDKYTVKMQAPYFTSRTDELNFTSYGNTWVLTPNFDTSQKRCTTIFVGPTGGFYFDKLDLNETNTTVTFLDEDKEGEYVFENGFLVVLTDIDMTMEIAIAVEGYESTILRRVITINEQPYHNWKIALTPLPENQ